jgi:predicted GTPase
MPKDNEHNLRINYMIQARVRPPHFICFVNSRGLFDPAYERFLLRNMAKEFGMNGIPLRVTLRSTNNRENKRASTVRRKKSKMQERMDELRKKYGNFGA